MTVILLLISVPVLTGLAGPDGLFATADGIYICEETAGRILFYSSDGNTTEIASGLESPEGICVSPDGAVLVVEDSKAGRLLEIRNGSVTTIATDLCCPEGVTVDPNGKIWFTTGGIEGGSAFTILWSIEDAVPVREYSLPSVFSFSDIEAASDGIIYICSESSGIFGNVAVFKFDPASKQLTPFVTGVTACEGIGMTERNFPLYITQETGSVFEVDSSGASLLLIDNLSTIEDVVVWNESIFISEDGTGSLLRMPLHE